MDTMSTLNLLTREQKTAIYTLIERALNGEIDEPYMTNCPNCGAPITSDKCEYCGTVFKRAANPDYVSFNLYKAQSDALRHAQDIKILYDGCLQAMRAYAGRV